MNNDPSIVHQITEYARQLFDVVGSSQLFSDESLLIMELESMPERDLDEFGRIEMMMDVDMVGLGARLLIFRHGSPP